MSLGSGGGAAEAAVPYRRLSLFYLFYFSSIGIFVPYWGLYLQALGFSPAEIGELIAISLASKVVAPYLWGWLADHSGRRLLIIRLTSLLGALGFALVLVQQSFLWLACSVAVFSFFWHAVLPQFEVTTLNHLGRRDHAYGHIRLWGSVGFILAVVGFGAVVDLHGVATLPWVMLLLLALIWLSTLWVTNSPESQHPPLAGSILAALKRPEVIALLLAAALMQLSHGPYYAFFSIYLESHGYAGSAIGQLWALGVVAEIAVFLFMHRLLPRFGAVRLFQFSIFITSIRWVLISLWPQHLPVLLGAQLMHAASYGLFHAAAIGLITRYFPGKLQGRGQAIYGSLSFGLGNALGTLGSGYLWSEIGAGQTYLLAAACCALGWLVSMRLPRQA